MPLQTERAHSGDLLQGLLAHACLQGVHVVHAQILTLILERMRLPWGVPRSEGR